MFSFFRKAAAGAAGSDEQGAGAESKSGDESTCGESQPSACQQPAVRITAVPERDAVLSGVKNKVKVLLQIETAPLPATRTRPPVHLAAVLDKSGSMEGNKLKWSKRAIRKLIKHMDAEKDTFHFVTYDTHVQTVFEGGDLSNKDALEDQVRAVRSGTSTNLYGGLERGVEVLQKGAASTEAEEAIKRVFIFSDGQVNQGLRDNASILRHVDGFVAKGVTVSSFGIGRSFDERLMRGLAERGKGDYFFLREDDITATVSKSIHGLLSTVGTEAVLRVRGVGGAVVSRIWSHSDTALVEGASIGDLHADNLKQILVELDITPPGRSQGQGEGQAQGNAAAVMEFSLEFVPTADAGAGAGRGGAQAVGAKQRLDGVLQLAVCDSAVERGPVQPAVAVAAAIMQAAEHDDMVESALAIRDIKIAEREKQRAIDILEAALELDGSGQIEQALLRARELLKTMQEQRQDVRVMQNQCMYDNMMQRAMSCEGLDYGCDSDDGQWSTDSEDDWDNRGGYGAPASPPPPAPQLQQRLQVAPTRMPPSPTLTYGRAGSDSDDGMLTDCDSDSDFA